MPRVADARFVLSDAGHLLAFGFGAGLSRRAPGTVGTLVAFPLFWLLQPRLSDAQFIVALMLMFALGVWVCGRTGRALGVADHGGMVWDEIVAFLVVLFLAPPGAIWQISGFLLFRAFDILKPGPIRYFDRTLDGGLGVMFDDLVAAFFTLLVLAVWKTVVSPT